MLEEPEGFGERLAAFLSEGPGVSPSADDELINEEPPVRTAATSAAISTIFSKTAARINATSTTATVAVTRGRSLELDSRLHVPAVASEFRSPGPLWRRGLAARGGNATS